MACRGVIRSIVGHVGYDAARIADNTDADIRVAGGHGPVCVVVDPARRRRMADLPVHAKHHGRLLVLGAEGRIHGVPTGITMDSTFSAKDQQAAMMFSVNRQISHTPPTSWINYNADGAVAAGNSNICIGVIGDPGCIVAYMSDYGSNNTAAGHRRWILYPQ